MTRVTSITRRHFLTTAALALVGSGCGWLGSLVRLDHEAYFAKALGRRMVALLRFPESARVVGRAYLQKRPHEADIRLLVSSIGGSGAQGDRRGMMTDQAVLHNAFQAQCHRDFENGEIVSIGGWYLARSEARLCALAIML